MPNQISELTMIKATLAAAYFVVTLLSGMFTRKMLTWKGKKRNFTLSQFAAGLILGTAMMDLMVESDLQFHVMRFKYPMAFLIFCAGYAVAMLVDCLLARAVSRLSLEPSHPKFLDGLMLDLVADLEPTKYYDISEAKKSSGIGYLGCAILDRLTVLVDCSFLLYTFSVLSMSQGLDIGGADTKTMAWRAFLNATSYNIIYAASMAITAQSLDQCTPLIGHGFLVFISLVGSAGVIIEWIFSNYDIIPGTGPTDLGGLSGFGDKFGPWIEATMPGFLAGVLVHLSVHHLLVDDNKTRYGKLVAVIFGLGMISLLKVLQI